jgi:hypothetical protein
MNLRDFDEAIADKPFLEYLAKSLGATWMADLSKMSVVMLHRTFEQGVGQVITTADIKIGKTLHIAYKAFTIRSPHSPFGYIRTGRVVRGVYTSKRLYNRNVKQTAKSQEAAFFDISVEKTQLFGADIKKYDCGIMEFTEAVSLRDVNIVENEYNHFRVFYDLLSAEKYLCSEERNNRVVNVDKIKYESLGE